MIGLFFSKTFVLYFFDLGCAVSLWVAFFVHPVNICAVMHFANTRS